MLLRWRPTFALYVSQKAGGVSGGRGSPRAAAVRVVARDGAPCTDGSHVYTTVIAALAVTPCGRPVVVCPANIPKASSVDRAVRLESFAGTVANLPAQRHHQRRWARVAGSGFTNSRSSRGGCRIVGATVVVENSLYLPLVLKVQ